jgi:RNA polymerase sigma-70 factor (ECF subfamily)
MPVSVKHDYPSAPDETLVRWAQQGDTEAFEQLVFRHRDKIYARALMMMRNEDQALEYSQEAWVKAWQRLVQFQGESSFATWVTRIVINLCLDQLRRQKRVRTESIEAMDEESGGVERQLPAPETNPTAGLEQDELRRRIDEALGKLTSIGTVMSRLFYARRRLAFLLQSLKRERSE